MNVLFISPLRPFDQSRIYNPCYPAGLLSISSYLESHVEDTSIKILDFTLLALLLTHNKANMRRITLEGLWRIALDGIGEFTPQIIGISISFCNIVKDLEPLVLYLKRRYPGALIVAGGHMVSNAHREILSKGSSLDAICFGEGEIPFAELTVACNEGEVDTYFSSSDVWVTKDKLTKQPDFTPVKKFIIELDTIPPYHLEHLVLFNEIQLLKKGIKFFVPTSRGCPNSCVFCAVINNHGRQIRTHSIERIHKDLCFYNKAYGIESFSIVDENFMHLEERAVGMLNSFAMIQDYRVDVFFASFYKITDRMIDALRKIGQSEVLLFLENGNENTLKNIINKPADLETAREAVDKLRAADFIVNTTIIFGFPGETKEAIQLGIDNMKRMGFNWYRCYIATPLPGSRLFDICEEGGYFVENVDPYEMHYGKCVIKTQDFDPEYIEHIRDETYLRLNYVENYDMQRGEFVLALKLFREELARNPGHAFAHYFAAKCCDKLGLNEGASFHYDKFNNISKRYPHWGYWKSYFCLPILNFKPRL